MTFLHAIVYGVVQGITEFLPISSSAHLVLLPWFLKWEDPGLAFDVALHWGTLLGVVLYYRKDLIDILVGFVNSFLGRRDAINILPWKIGLATLPAAVMGVLLEKQAETTLRSPWVMVGTLSIMGVVLWWADRRQTKGIELNEITWSVAMMIGAAQSLAIIPGVSRSGVTMSAALLLGLNRSAAVQFSFLLAIPITFGAGLFKINYLIQNITDPFVLTGIATSALAGFLAINFLVKFVRTKTFAPFAIYRVALAGIILIWLIK